MMAYALALVVWLGGLLLATALGAEISDVVIGSLLTQAAIVVGVYWPHDLF